MRGRHEKIKETKRQMKLVVGQRGGQEGVASAVVDGKARQGLGPEENKQGPFFAFKMGCGARSRMCDQKGNEQE